MEVVLCCLLLFVIVILFERMAPFYERFLINRKKKEFLEHESYYRNLISTHLRFFHCLDAGQQDKLLFRTYLFNRSRKFHYVGVQASPEMPVLISAVAAQLTLGLETFSMKYFHNIYVLEHDYHYGYYSLPFMGHVDSSGIYLSWDNFLKGLVNTRDSSNVGLHEMAHALAYVNFITKTDEDKHFIREFRNFSKIARPIFQEMQKGKRNFLGDYAASNYHEFWAVSVEMFFENPLRFRHELPALYAAMARVLNQDPIEQIKYKRTLLYKSVVRQ